MKRVFLFFVVMIVCFIAQAENCKECHQEEQNFFLSHDPELIGCTSCHVELDSKDIYSKSAHNRFESYPGRMQTINKTCSRQECHAILANHVKKSIMNSLNGMIQITRNVFDEEFKNDTHLPINQRLSFKNSDSYLRKLCVSCHLSNERKNHSQSVNDRGGGCSACHLKIYPNSITPDKNTVLNKTIQNGRHPSLTLKIESERCFGCHSRSSRVALNYYGYGEVEKIDPKRPNDFGILPDDRLVEIKDEDLHKKAGMDCIDCHTVNGVMGDGSNPKSQREQTDIACRDCHGEPLLTKKLHEFTITERKLLHLLKDINPLDKNQTVIVSQRKNTPLLHIKEKLGKRILKTKIKGNLLIIPILSKGNHQKQKGHERLSCNSCHSGWAPMCYGCHIEYDPQKTQWDHLLKKTTKGKWIEKRWHIVNDLPTLGVDKNQITTFVPGMNIWIEKPGQKPIIKRLFSPVSPHTTQKISRTCQSCHVKENTLGIINKWISAPFNSTVRTPNGWILKDQLTLGESIYPGARSLSKNEIIKIKRVGDCLKCHKKDKDKIFLDFSKSIRLIGNQKNHQQMNQIDQ